MTTHSLRRWGGLLIAGGVVIFVAYLFFPSTANDQLLPVCAASVLVGLLLLLPGLFALQRGQSERAAVNGWIGAGLLAAGIALLEFPHCILALVDIDRLRDLDSYHASFFGQAEFFAIIAVAVGQLVLAVAILRARVYPRWAAGIIVVDAALSIAAMAVPDLSDWLRIPAPDYLLFGLLGTAMIRLAGRREASLAGVNTPVEAVV
jgi:drug/metabolite transporter (DMT)-like permease